MNRLSCAIALALFGTAALAADWRDKASSGVITRAAQAERVDVLIQVRDHGPLGSLDQRQKFESKLDAAVVALRASAAATQRGLIAELSRRGIAHRAYWVSNVIAANVAVADLEWIAARPEVQKIESDAPRHFETPPNEFDIARSGTNVLAIESGVNQVRAPQVWAMGYTGQNVVIAGQDTGYQWDHLALRGKYRGWNGASADHNFNWWDAIHADVDGNGTNPCGFNAVAPCDDNSHGTHTMGTMVGDDGGTNQVGVAPGAKWISCRNMESGTGRPSSYIECFQFLMAPTNLAGTGADVTKAPHVISNSWGCPVGPPPSGEDCVLNSIEATVNNVKAAGILVVVAAGNGGSGCNTITDPPAIYSGSYTVGSVTSSNAISSFSSRGPITVDGSNRLKPDISAPGSSVRSTVPGGGYGLKSGTSMATPHVAGVAALVMSAVPALKGQPAMVEQILRDTATPLTSTQNCGSFPGANVPNAVFGYGLINAEAAVQEALATILEGDLMFKNDFE
jgi:subtilisin family serine protease